MIDTIPTFYDAIRAYGRGLSTVIDPPYCGFELLDGLETAEQT